VNLIFARAGSSSAGSTRFIGRAFDRAANVDGLFLLLVRLEWSTIATFVFYQARRKPPWRRVRQIELFQYGVG
jgi:hypothetical protein